MKLVIYSPCIENPSVTYKGPESENYETVKYLYQRFAEIKAKYKDVIFRPYPCPEFLLTLSAPRVPCSKEMYEALGMKKIAIIITQWIKKLVEELKPEKVIIVGKKYSPTCGVTGTYKLKDKTLLEKLLPYAVNQDLNRSKEIKGNMQRVEGESGVLMEILKKELPYAMFVDIDGSSIETIERDLSKLEKLLES